MKPDQPFILIFLVFDHTCIQRCRWCAVLCQWSDYGICSIRDGIIVHLSNDNAYELRIRFVKNAILFALARFVPNLVILACVSW